MTTEHLVVRQQDMSVHCSACGASVRMDLPVNVDVWLAAACAFSKLHAAHGVVVSIPIESRT
jgi:hypothetical protein